MSNLQATLSLPANRNRLDFNEVLRRWQWMANDLKEAVINGHLIPCLFEKGALWPLRSTGSGKRTRTEPALFVDQWMFLVGVKPTGPFDCKFEYLAFTHDALEAGLDVFKRDGSGFVDNRVTLSEVVEHGTFTLKELQRYEAAQALVKNVDEAGSTSLRSSWWQIEYDIVSMAKSVEARWKNSDRSVNQSGARAGKYSLTSLGNVVASEIEKAEKANKSPRTISGKSIINFLKSKGWN